MPSIPTARISASNIIERHTAPLDARSAVALGFTQWWLAKHASIRPVPGVIVRRALQLLADHLSHLDGDRIANETRTFGDCGKGEGSALTLTEARARIEAHDQAPARQPMAHWLDALRPAEERQQMADMLERLEALMDESA